MPQSLSRLVVHAVFSTKNRERVFLKPVIRNALCAYAGGILRNLGCPSIVIGAAPDHMHLLFVLSRTASVADVIGTVKRETSCWIKTQEPERKYPALVKFHWQDGYGAFSVSESNRSAAQAYVEGQEQHHRRRSFQEEYRLLLEKHGVPFDERYVWD
jgi:putative transposase